MSLNVPTVAVVDWTEKGSGACGVPVAVCTVFGVFNHVSLGGALSIATGNESPAARRLPNLQGACAFINFLWTHVDEANRTVLELIKYMGNPLWSSVPGGRDALDLLCITFSAYQIPHDSSLLFCAEVSGSGLRLAERVLSWVEDLKGSVKAEGHVHVKGVYFVTAVMNATMSTLLCHLCCYVRTSANHVWLLSWTTKEQDANGEPGAVCLLFPCKQGWRDHHSGTYRNRTHERARVQLFKAIPVAGPFTPELGEPPRV